MTKKQTTDIWLVRVYKDGEWPYPPGWCVEGYFRCYRDAEDKLNSIIANDPRIKEFEIRQCELQ